MTTFTAGFGTHTRRSLILFGVPFPSLLPSCLHLFFFFPFAKDSSPCFLLFIFHILLIFGVSHVRETTWDLCLCARLITLHLFSSCIHVPQGLKCVLLRGRAVLHRLHGFASWFLSNCCLIFSALRIDPIHHSPSVFWQKFQERC